MWMLIAIISLSVVFIFMLLGFLWSTRHDEAREYRRQVAYFTSFEENFQKQHPRGQTFIHGAEGLYVNNGKAEGHKADPPLPEFRSSPVHSDEDW